jgi:hypothetical protein
MATQVQWRRGTAAQVALFTGAVGEIVYGTDATSLYRLYTNDGATEGGHPVAMQNGDTINAAVLNETEIKNIASAATINLGAAGGNYLQITGNTGITSFGPSVSSTGGAERELVFTGTPTITNSSSLICPTGANITVQVGDTCRVRDEGSNVWRIVAYTRATGMSLATTPFVANGYINGLTLSNDSGTPNTKIDVAAGMAADSTNVVNMSFSGSAKVVDFTVNGAGGLDTGSITSSSWYAILLITGSSGTSVMATKETAGSAISPTMPSGYTYYRYIGSVKTDGSSHLLAFTQFGQTFYWAAQPHDLNSGAATVATLTTLSVPLGINVTPIITATQQINNNAVLYIWSPSYGSTAPAGFFSNPGLSGPVSFSFNSFVTNTSGQLYYKVSSASFTLDIYTTGWIDPHVSPVF